MALIIYNILIGLLYPVYLIASLLMTKVREFRRSRISGLNALLAYDAQGKHPIWLHAASVGELDQALALAREIKLHQADQMVVISLFSLSVSDKPRPEADLCFYLPLDLPWSWQPVIAHLQPEAFVTMTWDVFPNLLASLERNKIPAYLCSGALALNSARLKFPARLLHRSSYSRFSGIGAADIHSVEAFKQLTDHPERVALTGDSRYDSIFYKLEHNRIDPQWNKSLEAIPDPIWIMGSTYRADDLAIFPYLPELIKRHPDYRCIIFPHHIDAARISELEQNLQYYQLPFIRLSTWNHRDTAPIFIADVMGILALAYARSSFSYVGGAFHHRVHNVAEPAALANPVITGPRIESSPAATLLEQAGSLFCCDRGAMVAEIIGQLMSDSEQCRSIGLSAKALIESQRGGATRFYRQFLTEHPVDF